MGRELTSRDFTLQLATEVSALRSIQHLITGPDFGKMFDSASDHAKEELVTLKNKFDVDGIRDWIKKHKEVALEDMPVKELRKIAARLAVGNYHLLSKPFLLSEIVRLRNAQNACQSFIRRDAGLDAGSRSSAG